MSELNTKINVYFEGWKVDLLNLVNSLLTRTRIPLSCHVFHFSVGHQLADKFNHGMRHWREQTCIQFVPKSGHRDWIELYREQNPDSRR